MKKPAKISQEKADALERRVIAAKAARELARNTMGEKPLSGLHDAFDTVLGYLNGGPIPQPTMWRFTRRWSLDMLENGKKAVCISTVTFSVGVVQGISNSEDEDLSQRPEQRKTWNHRSPRFSDCLPLETASDEDAAAFLGEVYKTFFNRTFNTCAVNTFNWVGAMGKRK